MIRSDAFDQVEVTSATALWDWLATHHGQAQGVWLVTWKKHVSDRYIPKDQVLDALIAHGWTDGLMRKIDTDRVMQLIAPRRQQVWAQTYKDRAARLEAEGRMHPAGRAAIVASQAAGLWDAMADVDALIVPDDLATALSGQAAAFFHAAAPSYRRNVLRWIAGAKTAPTRVKRIAEVANRSAARQKVPQF